MSLQSTIEMTFESRAGINPNIVTPEVREVIPETTHQLDSGRLHVVERLGVGEWKVNEWAKKAALLSSRIQDNEALSDGANEYFDRAPARFADWPEDEFRSAGFYAVPDAIARRGSFVAKDAMSIPSYVNIGAYVDEGAIVDTWVTVGPCIQIGKSTHLSGGAGIGDVLELLQVSPTTIEDNCFIGARSEIVEGMIIEGGSVTPIGVFTGQSIGIFDRTTSEIYQGHVPAGSAVISGNMLSKNDSHSFYCTVIVKHADAQTCTKTSMNELLRGI